MLMRTGRRLPGSRTLSGVLRGFLPPAHKRKCNVIRRGSRTGSTDFAAKIVFSDLIFVPDLHNKTPIKSACAKGGRLQAIITHAPRIRPQPQEHHRNSDAKADAIEDAGIRLESDSADFPAL